MVYAHNTLCTFLILRLLQFVHSFRSIKNTCDPYSRSYYVDKCMHKHGPHSDWKNGRTFFSQGKFKLEKVTELSHKIPKKSVNLHRKNYWKIREICQSEEVGTMISLYAFISTVFTRINAPGAMAKFERVPHLKIKNTNIYVDVNKICMDK